MAVGCAESGDEEFVDELTEAESQSAATDAIDLPLHALERADRALAMVGNEVSEEELLSFVSEANTYAQASALVRLALQPDHVIPSNPPEPGLSFEGYAVEIPEAVQAALRERREARDRRLRSLPPEALANYRAATINGLRAWRKHVAAERGWPFVEAEIHGSIVAYPNGELRQRPPPPAGAHLSTPNIEPSFAAPAGPGEVGEHEQLDEVQEETRLNAIENGDDLDIQLDDPRSERTNEGPSLSSEVSKLGQIIGSDDRRLRSWKNGFDMTDPLFHVKGALIPHWQTPSTYLYVDSKCTATKVGPRLLVSAAHCFYENGSFNNIWRWVPGADGIASPNDPNGWFEQEDRELYGGYYNYEWDIYDLSIMVLPDTYSVCQLHSYGIAYDPYLTQDSVNLWGYPVWDKKCSASTHSQDKCWGSMYGDAKKVVTQGVNMIRYYIDTQPGMSGAAVYELRGSTRYVVGVHNGPYGLENEGVWFNSNKFDWLENMYWNYWVAC